jgi:hypothetical protein
MHDFSSRQALGSRLKRQEDSGGDDDDDDEDDYDEKS